MENTDLIMTQEDKELILKDICGRLPYCPIVQMSLYRNDGRKRDIELDPRVTENIWELIDKYCALPYLRPLSSMTKEEESELRILWNEDFVGERIPFYIYPCYKKTLDFYNEHHFDYRGLIEKGLAIEVTKENNPYEDYSDFI